MAIAGENFLGGLCKPTLMIAIHQPTTIGENCATKKRSSRVCPSVMLRTPPDSAWRGTFKRLWLCKCYGVASVTSTLPSAIANLARYVLHSK